jgi:hypothetical protein
MPVLLLLGAALVAQAGATAPDFDRDVAPVLARRCLGCHGDAEPKGGLDLSQRARALAGGESGPAIAPGQPEESPLWERVESGEMPPKAALPAAERAVLRGWIAAGAPWGADPIDAFAVTTADRAGRDWWAFGPVARPDPPAVSDRSWPLNPIDAFVLARLEREGLRPAPAADRRTLLRRLAFDLTGLPPAPEEVAAFEADARPDAYERLVDRLLASPQYGVRQARAWLDLARYGESNGFEFDEPRPNAWRYRDWVVNAFNADLPYGEFARLQIAGDALRPDDPAAVEATGFLVAGAYDTVGQNQQSAAMKAVVRQDELEDLVGTVGQAFLGLTIHCARCHDHKFDPVSQAEYYRVAAALSGVRHGERDLSGLDPSARAWKARTGSLRARLAAIEATGRARLGTSRPASGPVPIAAWDFERGADDPIHGLSGRLHGSARLTTAGLKLDGKTAYLATAPLPRALRTRTLEAWVRLDRLDQRGGAAMSLQSLDGERFDAIVFGEREPGRWMAGSESFARTQSFRGPAEVEAARRVVCIAVSYASDGTVTAYRDGRPHGIPFRAEGPIPFEAGQAQILFGLRHGEARPDRLLAGAVVRARLYDRALAPEEVAASAAASGAFFDPDALLAALTPDERAEREEIRKALQVQADPPRRAAYAVRPREPGPSRVLLRGNPATPGADVAPGAVGLLARCGLGADLGLAADAPEAERRRRLAAWITDPRNALFARVAANRAWLAHFGAGLVETPSDLGFSGGRPSHPELLDWLAAELTHQGGSLKALHRVIVTSAAYRQGGRFDAGAAGRDAGARLLWRRAPRRLEAEMVRDAMLAVAGELEPTLGGPSFADVVARKAEGTAAMLFEPADPAAPGLRRRSLYRAWARGGRSALLDAFDCPDPSTPAPRRAATTTPLQALALMNNALTLHLADRLAARLEREAGPDPSRQVDRAYALALGRSPTPAERERAAAIVGRLGAAPLARALFNANEFLYID